MIFIHSGSRSAAFCGFFRNNRRKGLPKLALALLHRAQRRIIVSVAVKNCVKGKPNAAGISRRPWTSKPRPKKEDKDLSQWPKGTTQPLTKVMASKLFSLISTSDDSLHGLLAKNPWLPPFRDLTHWRKTQPWFATE